MKVNGEERVKLKVKRWRQRVEIFHEFIWLDNARALALTCVHICGYWAAGNVKLGEKWWRKKYWCWVESGGAEGKAWREKCPRVQSQLWKLKLDQDIKCSLKNKSKVARGRNDTTITFKLLKPLNTETLTIEEFANTGEKKTAVCRQYCSQAMLLYGQFSWRVFWHG